MRNIHFLLNLLLLIFTFNKYSLVHAEEALAKLWEVDESLLLDLLAMEEKLTIVDRTVQLLIEDYDSSFGGTHLDVKDKKVYVNTVDFSEIGVIINASEIIKNNYSDFISFVPATNSMATLIYRFNNIANLTKNLRPVSIQCYIDMRLNNVVIRHLKANNIINAKFLNSVKEYEPTLIEPKAPLIPGCKLRTTAQNQALKDNKIDVKALIGDGMFNNLTEHYCTIGFYARSNESESEKYIVTAGHCSSKSSQLDAQTFFLFPWEAVNSGESYPVLGQIIESENIDLYDFGLIDITDKDFDEAVIRNTDSEHRELILKGGKVITSYGTHLCKSGLISHVTCGYVRGLNAVSSNHDGFRSGLILAGKDFETIACPGDSGSPAFSYLQNLSTVSLNGILIRGFKDLTAFVPLDLILSKGRLELIRTP